MPSSIKLSVRFTQQTVRDFNRILPGVPWSWHEFLNEVFIGYDFECATSPMTVADLCSSIEDTIQSIYEKRLSKFVGVPGQLIMQVYKLQVYKSDAALEFRDQLLDHMKPGDTVVADGQAIIARDDAQPREWTDTDLYNFRKQLRFDLNDRVLCNFGPRWLSGHIVGTAVPEEDELLPYLVKTDPVPGLPSKSISVPFDTEQICVQEVCFDASSQLQLIKAAAALVSESKKPKLRFTVGDPVVCRIRNDPKDGLEQWVPGAIEKVWPKLPGENGGTWHIGGASGKFPDMVPYRIELASGGCIYCHRDDHTLIRRQGMEPMTRVKGISKRMEVRKCGDGVEERIDHVTERRKRLMAIEASDSE